MSQTARVVVFLGHPWSNIIYVRKLAHLVIDSPFWYLSCTLEMPREFPRSLWHLFRGNVTSVQKGDTQPTTSKENCIKTCMLLFTITVPVARPVSISARAVACTVFTTNLYLLQWKYISSNQKQNSVVRQDGVVTILFPFQCMVCPWKFADPRPTRPCLDFYDDVIIWKHFQRCWQLWGESTGHRWVPITKATDAELRWFRWSEPEQTVEWTLEKPLIWDATAPIVTSL